ncbi:MAG TPA: glycosyltransferase family 2 protein, partial [Chloroflexota bacterium]|nr:glycosyltransferase family 2 protein [Chloroflexota bacterium]
FHFPTLWMSFFDFFPVNHRFIDSRLNGRYPLPKDGAPFPVDHPLGAAMMIRREALESVGMLDEEYFMYCEEVDWCIRAKQSGWQIYQLPSAKVVHHVGGSSRQFREEMLIQLHRSRYRLFGKHYGSGFVAAHRAITRLGLAREMSRTRWEACRGRMSKEEMERRLRTYETIWGM